MAELMTQAGPFEAVAAAIEANARLFSKDIEAMDHDSLAKTCGGKSRAAYDLIYEVVGLNRAIEGCAKGRPFGDLPKGWVTAPAEFRDKDKAASELKSSVSDVASALRATPAEKKDQLMTTPFGEMKLGDVADIAAMHLMYHSGQLNYIQTICGDDDFHWF